MTYSATVVDVAVAAAPGTDDARAVVESALHSWSASRASSSGVVLVPKRLPAAAPSERMRLIDNADVLVALTSGPDVDAATSAAIARASVLGRPVHLYRPADRAAAEHATGETCTVPAVAYANGGELYRRLWHAMEHDALAATRTTDEVDPAWDAQFPAEDDGTLVHREPGLDDFGALLMDDEFAAAVADRILSNLYSDYWYAASPQARQSAVMHVRQDPAAAMLLALRTPIPLQWHDVRLARADGRFLS